MALSLIAALALMGPGSVTRYVDPMIGTGGPGHTFPGATWPHGMVQLSPDTGTDGWEHCSGYHHDDKSILGFSHTHLSGTGCPDLGDVLIAPNVDNVKFSPADYKSRFDHKEEIAKAGYYEVFLQDPKVRAQMTVTRRNGIHRYTFPKTERANITFDINHNIGGQNSYHSSVKWISPTEVEGSIFTHGWANDQRLFFVAKLSRPAKTYGIAIDNKQEQSKTEAEGKFKSLDAFATFDATNDQVVMLKVGISNVDPNGARANLEADAKHWDFNKYVREANSAWDKQLKSVQVTTGSDSEKRSLYTSLYHAYIHPSLYQDADGRYMGMDHKIHQASAGSEYYHVYSLWDTYRASHPMFELLEPSKNAQFINGMLDRYKIRGELPVWELASCETYCMIGDPAVPAVANAIVNGNPGIDPELALKAVDASLLHQGRGQSEFLKYGFVPSDKTDESVSKTLEFAYANGAASQMATKLGRKDLAETYWARAQAYKQVFDPAQGLMCPKTADGKFVPGYNPVRLDYEPRYVTEGNSWQYNWLVMHDLPGLISLYGGEKPFIEKLTATFALDNHPIGAQEDVSGLIGQYAHGNEPSHHTAYMFTLGGRSDLTEKYIREVRTRMYVDKFDGLCGNDDAGQMSAWYIFSVMGFYPVDPASGEYVLGVPMFNNMTVKLENGKTIRIIAKNLDVHKDHVQEVRWNGKKLENHKISHQALTQGGTLEFRGN